MFLIRLVTQINVSSIDLDTTEVKAKKNQTFEMSAQLVINILKF